MCCKTSICESCVQRTDKCPFCTIQRAETSQPSNFVQAAKYKQGILDQIRNEAIAKYVGYYPEKDNAFDEADRYYNIFQPHLDTLADNFLFDPTNIDTISDRFLVFAVLQDKNKSFGLNTDPVRDLSNIDQLYWQKEHILNREPIVQDEFRTPDYNLTPADYAQIFGGFAETPVANVDQDELAQLTQAIDILGNNPEPDLVRDMGLDYDTYMEVVAAQIGNSTKSPRGSPPRSPVRSPGRSPRTSPARSPTRSNIVRRSPTQFTREREEQDRIYRETMAADLQRAQQSAQASTSQPRTSPARSPRTSPARSLARSPARSPGRVTPVVASPRPSSPTRSPGRTSPPRSPRSASPRTTQPRAGPSRQSPVRSPARSPSTFITVRVRLPDGSVKNIRVSKNSRLATLAGLIKDAGGLEQDDKLTVGIGIGRNRKRYSLYGLDAVNTTISDTEIEDNALVDLTVE
jgi:hypothetical protein